MKRQHIDWVKIFIKDTSAKGLFSKIHKLLKFNHKKTKQLKRGKYLNKSNENVQIANKHMKRLSKSHVFRKLQMKTTRCQYTPIRMAKNLKH